MHSARGREAADGGAAGGVGSGSGSGGTAATAPAAVAPSRTSGGARPRARGAQRSAGSGAAAGAAGLQPLQAKLQQHIDREDRRIKELTEGILYHFFPEALRAVLPPGADPATGLDAEGARRVAVAALAVATLMNAPPGFLEFLLCMPWDALGPLYLRPEGPEGARLVPHLAESACEPSQGDLVNVRLDPSLIDCVLDFLYRPVGEQHQESLPPMIKLTPPSGLEHLSKGAEDPSAVTRETVSALLDGATPLHCAAIRGNPAQVDHLLLCGADPLLPNAAGELPVEVVPVCGDRCLGNGKLSCRCMGARDQEAWECRSRLARSLILRSCVVQFRSGVAAWFRMAMLCLLCLLGFWGNHTTLHRPAIDAHAAQRAEQRRKRLLKRTQATLLKMRTNAAAGREALDSGGGAAGAAGAGTSLASKPPDPHEASGSRDAASEAIPAAAASGGDGGACIPSLQADRAYHCYSQAVQLLEELDLRPGSVPAGFIEAEADTERTPHACVYPDEQAAIYCGWAEAALRKARSCACTGCAALAMHAVAAGQKQVAGLLASPELSAHRQQERVARVGAAMARLVHCKAALLLATDVRASATRAGVWRAQQCLAEWERLRSLGMTAGLGEEECLDMQCLDAWCRAAASDMLLLEALQGAPLLPLQPLSEVLPAAVAFDPASGAPALLRTAGRDVVQQLHIVRVAEAVAGSLQAEMSAGDRLRDLLQPRSGGMGVDELAEAIRAAERYPSLAAEVEAARGLKERWIKRAEAQAHFDAAVERLSGPAAGELLRRPAGGGAAAAPELAADAFWSELNARLAELEAATEEARQANIGVARAKRVLKELQAQGVAVEAAARLDEALAQPRSASAALKSVLSKAEAAAAAAATGACQFAVGAELLQPRIQAAKAKLELEKAAEGLARAATGCKGVADLPRLEAAILAARRVGAHELDADAYRAASELRLRLDGAARSRAALEAALRSLDKLGRQDDADAVERCIEEAEACDELLLPEAARAREAVHRWRVAAAAEARLTRALRDGVGPTVLGRAIKEAAAAGCKQVGEARRLLKLMQGLEAAVQAAAEGPLQYQALKARIEQAEAGGCPEGLVSDAKRQLHRLLLAEVKGELEAALKLSRGAEKSVAQRLSGLKAVLDKADAVLAMDEELQALQAQQAQQAGAAGMAGTAGSAAEPSEAGLSDAAAGQEAQALARSDPGSVGSLPPGRLVSLTSLDSAQAAAAASAAASASVYVSAAPSVSAEAGGEGSEGGDDSPQASVLLEAVGEDSAQLSILLPAGADADAADGGESSDAELPAELAGDDLAVVRHMTRQARRQLAREEAEQARIERERQEESRARREQQQREKAERERADRERAEKAKAERAERKAALEAAKAERRERERQQRLEKERQRQEREQLAKEHFALLQKQRRLQAAAAAQAHVQAMLPPDVAAAAAASGLVPPVPGLALGGAAGARLGSGSGLFGSGMGPDAAAGATALELWASAHAGGSGSAAAAAGFAGLLAQAQHDRSDSLERLSEQQGLLDLLNDQPEQAAGEAAAAALSGESGEPGLSPSEGGGPAGGGGAGLGAPAFGSGRWSSVEGSLEGLQGGGADSRAPSASRTPEASPIKPGPGLAPAAGAAGSGAGSSRFLDFGSGLWGSSGAASGPAGAATAVPGPRASWSVEQAPGAGGSGSGSLLWGSSGNLAAAASSSSPGRPMSQDDMALTGLGSSRLWQPAAGSASASGDGWDQLLGGAAAQPGGAAGSLLASPQRPGAGAAGQAAPAVGPGGLPGGAAALALLQHRRQQQLIAALDAAKAQLLRQAAAGGQGGQGGAGGRQVCKYFVHGFCREGDNCRFAHVLPPGMVGGPRPGALDPQQQQQQQLLSLQRLSGGPGSGAGFDAGGGQQQQQQQQQQGGLLSFGAPGAAAFSSGGGAGGSRSGTPDLRLAGGGGGGVPPALQRSAGPAAGSGSGFSVGAPAFSPRDPLGPGGGGGGGAGGNYPPTSSALGGYGALRGGLATDPFGSGAFGGSRPASAAHSAFATPRDGLRVSAEAETYADAREGDLAEEGEEGHYAYYEGGEGEEAGRHEGGHGSGLYAPDPMGGYHGGFGTYAHLQPQRAGAGDDASHARSAEEGGGGEEGEEEWGDAAEGEARADSYGLPSEASLFRDLPDFLQDTTNE